MPFAFLIRNSFSHSKIVVAFLFFSFLFKCKLYRRAVCTIFAFVSWSIPWVFPTFFCVEGKGVILTTPDALMGLELDMVLPGKSTPDYAMPVSRICQYQRYDVNPISYPVTVTNTREKEF